MDNVYTILQQMYSGNNVGYRISSESFEFYRRRCKKCGLFFPDSVYASLSNSMKRHNHKTRMLVGHLQIVDKSALVFFVFCSMKKTLPIRKWVTMRYCYLKVNRISSHVIVNSYKTVAVAVSCVQRL